MTKKNIAARVTMMNTITVVNAETNTAVHTSRVPPVGGDGRRFAHLPVAVDIFQHHDGGVHHHADGKCNAGQRDHV